MVTQKLRFIYETYIKAMRHTSITISLSCISASQRLSLEIEPKSLAKEYSSIILRYTTYEWREIGHRRLNLSLVNLSLM